MEGVNEGVGVGRRAAKETRKRRRRRRKRRSEGDKAAKEASVRESGEGVKRDQKGQPRHVRSVRTRKPTRLTERGYLTLNNINKGAK